MCGWWVEVQRVEGGCVVCVWGAGRWLVEPWVCVEGVVCAYVWTCTHRLRDHGLGVQLLRGRLQPLRDLAGLLLLLLCVCVLVFVIY